MKPRTLLKLTGTGLSLITVALVTSLFFTGAMVLKGMPAETEPNQYFTIAFKQVGGPTEQEIREVELKCKSEYDMAFYIQKTRIVTGDSWEVFEARVLNGYHPGEPLGYATTPEQIEIKDAFYEKTLIYADFIYHHTPRGWAPDKVADVFVDACIIKEETRLRDKYSIGDDKAQTYNI